MRDKKYIGAYRDDRGRVRPITAPTGRLGQSSTGIPLRRNQRTFDNTADPLESLITIDGVTRTRREWLEHDGKAIFVVDGKPSLSQYFYSPVESYQPRREWTDTDQAEYKERERREDIESKRAYEEWLNREPTESDSAMALLSATSMSRRDRKVWEGMEAQLVAHAHSPNMGSPLTPKQEKYIVDIARRYKVKMRSTARARGAGDPVFLEAYRDVFKEDPLNG